MTEQKGEDFPESVVNEAWARAARGEADSEWAFCECERVSHENHGAKVPCGALLVKSNRGRTGIGCWEANHRLRRESEGTGVLSNCEILCWPCHRKTLEAPST